MFFAASNRKSWYFHSFKLCQNLVHPDNVFSFGKSLHINVSYNSMVCKNSLVLMSFPISGLLFSDIALMLGIWVNNYNLLIVLRECMTLHFNLCVVLILHNIGCISMVCIIVWMIMMTFSFAFCILHSAFKFTFTFVFVLVFTCGFTIISVVYHITDMIL